MCFEKCFRFYKKLKLDSNLYVIIKIIVTSPIKELVPKTDEHNKLETEKLYFLWLKKKTYCKWQAISNNIKIYWPALLIRHQGCQHFYLNIIKTIKKLLSIIEAKLFLLTFFICFILSNYNPYCDKVSRGATTLKHK